MILVRKFKGRGREGRRRVRCLGCCCELTWTQIKPTVCVDPLKFKKLMHTGTALLLLDNYREKESLLYACYINS